MSVATLARHTDRTPLPERLSGPSRAAMFERVEDELLARAIPVHPACDAALDAALDDMALLSAELRDARRRPLLLRSTTQLNQIEDLLLEAVVRTHPNRERALERLIDDLCCANDSDDNEPDNDFDGMG